MEINLLTFGAALVAGLATFLSPCVLPLIPTYLLYISGAIAKEAVIKKRAKTLALSLAFALGIAVIFSALGASASLIGMFLLRYHGIVEKVVGLIIIFLGLNLAGVIAFAPFLRHRRYGVEIGKLAGNALGALLVGISFGLSWTPCIGLELGAFYFLASQEATVLQGAALLFTFAMGLGLPFIIAGLALERFGSFYRKIGRHLRTIQIISGLMVCIIGLLVLTGEMRNASRWLVHLV